MTKRKMTKHKTLALLVALGAAGISSAASRYDPLPVESRDTEAENIYFPSPAASEQTVKPNSQSQSEASAGRQAGVSAPAIPANAQWELYSQLQQMQDEVQRLRGVVDELGYQLDQIKRQQRDRYLDLDQRINQIKSGSGVSGSASSMPAVESVAQVKDEKETYNTAMQLLRERKFNESIGLLEQLIAMSPEGMYAPYGEYWLGELYMALVPAQYDVAKEHFIRLLTQFPEHSKVSDGMFKLGKLYHLKGEQEKARVTLQKVVKDYPGKPAAKLAQELLSKL